MEKIKLKKYKIIRLSSNEFYKKDIKNSSNYGIFKNNKIGGNNIENNHTINNKTYTGFIDSDYSDLIYNNDNKSYDN